MQNYNNFSREKLITRLEEQEKTIYALSTLQRQKKGNTFSCLFPAILLILGSDGICVEQIVNNQIGYANFNNRIMGRLSDQMTPDNALLFEKQLAYAVNSRLSCCEDYLFLENGEIYCLKICLIPINDHYIICQMQDISENYRSKEQINELDSVLESILDNIPAYICVKDPNNDFRYVYWSKACEQIFSIPKEEIINKTDEEIPYFRSKAAELRKLDQQLYETGSRVDFIESFTLPSGEEMHAESIRILVPFENNRRPLIVNISWDISTLIKTEKKLIQMREKAEESDRLKSTFLANMSHEIRTPLNAIVGFSKIIQDVSDSEEKEMYGQIIDSNTTLLLQLINDILDISKIEAGTLEFIYAPVDLDQLCSDIFNTHSRLCPDGVNLCFDSSSTPVTIFSDRNRVAQVLSNLINNATKFTTKGHIRFGYQMLGDDTIEFQVSDTGKGIPAKQIDTIFNRFTKLHAFIQGTGLGLSICKTIVEKLGGSIRVESVESKGATFYFTLPIHQKEINKPALAI